MSAGKPFGPTGIGNSAVGTTTRPPAPAPAPAMTAEITNGLEVRTAKAGGTIHQPHPHNVTPEGCRCTGSAKRPKTIPMHWRADFTLAGPLGIAFVQSASGVRVLHTKPGSPAHTQNVPVGGRLMAIADMSNEHGWSTERCSHDEIIALISQAGRPMSMTFEMPSTAAPTSRVHLTLQQQQQQRQEALPSIPVPAALPTTSQPTRMTPDPAVPVQPVRSAESRSTSAATPPSTAATFSATPTELAARPAGQHKFAAPPVATARNSHLNLLRRKNKLPSDDELHRAIKAEVVAARAEAEAARAELAAVRNAAVVAAAAAMRREEQAVLAARVAQAAQAQQAAHAATQAAEAVRAVKASYDAQAVQAAETARAAQEAEVAKSVQAVQAAQASQAAAERAAAAVYTAMQRQEQMTRDMAEAVDRVASPGLHSTLSTPSPTLRSANGSASPSTIFSEVVHFCFEQLAGPAGLVLHDDDGRLLVERVLPLSPASNAGVPLGHELVAVNSESVRGQSKTAVGHVIARASRPLVLSFVPPPSTVRSGRHVTIRSHADEALVAESAPVGATKADVEWPDWTQSATSWVKSSTDWASGSAASTSSWLAQTLTPAWPSGTPTDVTADSVESSSADAASIKAVTIGTKTDAAPHARVRIATGAAGSTPTLLQSAALSPPLLPESPQAPSPSSATVEHTKASPWWNPFNAAPSIASPPATEPSAALPSASPPLPPESPQARPSTPSATVEVEEATPWWNPFNAAPSIASPPATEPSAALPSAAALLPPESPQAPSHSSATTALDEHVEASPWWNPFTAAPSLASPPVTEPSAALPPAAPSRVSMAPSPAAHMPSNLGRPVSKEALPNGESLQEASATAHLLTSAPALTVAKGSPSAVLSPKVSHAATAAMLPSTPMGDMLGKGVTPRTADKLRLPLESMRFGPAPTSVDARIPRDAHAELSSTRGLRGVPFTPVSAAPATATSASRARRTGEDSPLPSTARKRLSSGAYWLSELKLRPPRGHGAIVSEVATSGKPSAQCTPRDEHGAPLKPAKLIEYFNRRHSRGGEASPSARHDNAPQVDNALSARNQGWLFVKRGMLSENVVQTL